MVAPSVWYSVSVQPYLPLYDNILKGEPLNEKAFGLQSNQIVNVHGVSQP